jgi:hypothetical protein
VRGVVHKKLKEWCEGGEAAAESEVSLWKGMEGGGPRLMASEAKSGNVRLHHALKVDFELLLWNNGEKQPLQS